MVASPRTILVVLAVVLAVLSLIWPAPYIVQVAVLLLGIALLIG